MSYFCFLWIPFNLISSTGPRNISTVYATVDKWQIKDIKSAHVKWKTDLVTNVYGFWNLVF